MGRGALWKLARGVRASMVLQRRRYGWFRRNTHNETSAVNSFDLDKVSVGRYTYGALRVIDGYGTNRLRIGSFCSIAEDVVFILNGEHALRSMTTFPLRAFVLGMPEMYRGGRDIVVEDDVWIGHGALILPGVRIGKGSVVAAGAVVTGDIAPYAIVGGIPARQLGTRFATEVSARVKLLDLGLLSRERVQEHLSLLEQPIDEEVLAQLEALFGQSREGDESLG